MADEQKVETAATEIKADASQEAEEIQEEKKPIENKIDYEAEIRKEKEARQVAEAKLEETRLRSRERWEAKKEKEMEEEGEEKPLTARQLQEILQADRQAAQKDLQTVRIAEIARGLASSEAEANLIMEVHKNRSFPPHLALQEQVEEAYAIANRKRLVGERNEALRALQGKSQVQTDAAGTHHDAQEGMAPKVPSDVALGLQEGGFAYNPSTRQYEKKLRDGGILIRDWKLGQTWRKGVPRPPLS